MGSDANRLRRKWQDYSGKNGAVAEKNFFDFFNEIFQDTEYKIRKHPDEFKLFYVDYPLPEKDLQEIYNPSKPITKHGFVPDFAIDNLDTNKTIYIESKRQDGWVEGGKRSDGRGNVHERSCKFFTPGLLKALRQKSGITVENALPFWVIFQGNITRDPCRVREITCWYDGYPGHYFFWRDTTNPEDLLNHFIKYIKPLLD
jgi:hypothetical protein